MKEDYIGIVKERVRLKEGRSVLEKILSIIYFEGNISNKELAFRCTLPIPVVTAIKKEFIRLGILEQNKGIQLTKQGVDFVDHELGFFGMDIELYKTLLDDEKQRIDLITKLSEQYAFIYENRPQVDVTIDQAKCTVNTAFKRAMLCLENQSLIGKNILCVGDDDLISVAIGLLLNELYYDKEANRKKVCVFDVDERYIQYITVLAERYNLPIECLKIDLREPLPISYANSFDCFFTDPPYTTEGLSLFLSRGVSALKNEKGLRVFLSYGHKPIDEMKKVQEVILNLGFAITDIYNAFNEYEGASLLANVSQMMVLQSGEDIKTIVPEECKYLDKIYTGELRQKNSVYECKKCKEKIILDHNSRIRTIEQLKKEGCPNCGNKVFDLRKKQPSFLLEREKRSLSEHILADFYGCTESILKDNELIQQYMHEAAEKANATIVSEKFHTFSPWGVSGVIIIKESHLTIHTWPEYKYAAVDLFTCGDTLDLRSAMQYLEEKLGCKKMEYNDISRGLLNKL